MPIEIRHDVDTTLGGVAMALRIQGMCAPIGFSVYFHVGVPAMHSHMNHHSGFIGLPLADELPSPSFVGKDIRV